MNGAIVWHIHNDTKDRFLALEKRGKRAYPGESYVTFITGPNFSDLTDQDVDRMRQWAESNGIKLTTDRVSSRHY
jgi:hypothetical protein